MQGKERRDAAAEEAALRLVQEHAAELLRFARRFSHCADDAHDAYQRTLEILVLRLRRDPPSQLLPWVRTVLRHEAYRVRVERERLVDRCVRPPREPLGDLRVGRKRVQRLGVAGLRRAQGERRSAQLHG